MTQLRSTSQVQIAKALGLSQATVSHAINNPRRVSKRTQQRVQRMVDRLAYRPNAHARTLRTSRSRLVGVACGSPTDSYQAHLLASLEGELHRHGYQMVFHTCDCAGQELWTRIVEFVDLRACGVIFQNVREELYEQLRTTFPGMFAMVGLGATIQGATSVGCDNLKAATAVAGHLAALGRRRTALNILPGDLNGGPRRKAGPFAHAVRELGLPEPIEVCIQEPYYLTHLEEYGRVVTEAILRKHPDIDALYLSCDDIAVGAMHHLLSAGVRIPEDMAVVGFNDAPAARAAPVPLTTVRQPVEEYARLAVRLLVEQIERPKSFEPRFHRLECELMVRRSTDPSRPATSTEAPPPTVLIGEPRITQTV